MRKFSKKQYLAAGAAAALIAAGGGAAYAYWTTNGTGSGSASTSTGVATGITLSGNVTNAMYPGDSPQTVTFTAANNSGQSVYVTSVSAYLTVSQADGAVGTCDSTDYLLNNAAAPGDAAHAAALNWTAQEIANGQSATNTYSLQFNDKAAANQDGCKGASVTVNYLSN